jgi:anti-sigma factor RsiW
MDRVTDVELMRLVHGELAPPQAAELRARILREPRLAAALARLERTWNGLELAPPPDPPPGFAARILARARRRADRLTWSAAPGWVRAAAAAALAAGVALGAGAGSWATRRPGTTEEPPALSEVTAGLTPPSLAETYWDCLEDLGSEASPAAADGAAL